MELLSDVDSILVVLVSFLKPPYPDLGICVNAIVSIFLSVTS